MSKTLLIGWDAADWRAIEPLLAQGKMPNLEKLINGGVRGNLATLQPVLSPMLWSSIATGKRPYKHGIHGFSEPDPVTGTIRPVTNLSRKSKAIWNIFNQNDKNTITIGWWPSNPAEPLSKGVMVSNDYQRTNTATRKDWQMPPNTIHPVRLKDDLSEIRFHPEELTAEDFAHFIPAITDMNEEEIEALEKDPRLQSLAKIIADCTSIHSATTALMQNEPWDLLCVYYDAIDHFGHAFMKYHPPQQPGVSDRDYKIYNYIIEAGYRYHDLLLGTLVHLAEQQAEEVNILLVSDHGFHPDELRLSSIPREPAGPAAEHRQYGIIVGNGEAFKRGHEVMGANLLDICPTLLHLHGLPIAEDMDGKVLIDIFEKPSRIQSIPSWEDVAGDHGMHPSDKTISPEDAKASLDQLVALGYIDKPDEDKSKALEQTVRELDFNLAQSYMDGGIYAEALLILERLYQKWPEEHRFGINLGTCYEALGRNAEQKELVATIIERRLEQAHLAQEKLKELCLNTEEGAQAHKEKLDAMEPKEREIYIKKYRSDIAIAQPNLNSLQYLEAKAEFSVGNHQAALEKLAQLEKDAGAKLNTLSLRARIYNRMREYDKAEADYKHALKLDPENASCFAGLARIAISKRAFPEAIELMTKSLSLTFFNPKGHYTLGMAYYRSGEWESALACFKLALKQAPLYPAAWRMLSEIAKNHLRDPHQLVFFKEQLKLSSQKLREVKQKRLIETAAASEQIEDRRPMPELDACNDKLKEIADDQIITVVSGLPRSGTSLMMQMLQAAKLPIFEDGKRVADESNKNGYYEHDSVTQLMSCSREEKAWVSRSKGKAIKVVAPLLSSLPIYDQSWKPQSTDTPAKRQRLHYRVIFMERDMEEVLDSQSTMMAKMGKQLPKGDPAKGYSQQVRAAKTWLNAHSIPSISIDFSEIINDPAQQINKLASFLECEQMEDAMLAKIDPSLHRSKK